MGPTSNIDVLNPILIGRLIPVAGTKRFVVGTKRLNAAETLTWVKSSGSDLNDAVVIASLDIEEPRILMFGFSLHARRCF